MTTATKALELAGFDTLPREITKMMEQQFTLGRLVRRGTLDVSLKEAYTALVIRDDLPEQVRDLYIPKFGYSLATFIESDKKSGIASAKADVLALYGLHGVEATEDDISAAIRHLASKARLDECFFWCSPSVYVSMLKNPNPNFFSRADDYLTEDGALGNSYCGKLLYTIPCHRSSLTRVAANQSVSWMATRDAITLDMREPVVAAIRAEDEEPTTTGPISEYTRLSLREMQRELVDGETALMAIVPYAFRIHPDEIALVCGD